MLHNVLEFDNSNLYDINGVLNSIFNVAAMKNHLVCATFSLKT